MPDSGPQDLRRLSRRAALKVIASSASAAASFPIITDAQPRPGGAAAASLLPPRATAQTYAPKFFSAGQIRTLDALSEAIIPADEHSPGSRAARVWAFIDTVVAESDGRRKDFWTKGLAAIDKLAETETGKKYAECEPQQQISLLQKLSEKEEDPKTLEEGFFVAIKRATIDGYYTSRIGIHQELEYQGNTALVEFEGCAHEDHRKQ